MRNASFAVRPRGILSRTLEPRRLARGWGGPLLFLPALALAQIPDSLVLDGVPALPAETRRAAGRYLEFRSAIFNDWHPRRRELLIVTRFGDAPQLHLVRRPAGARKQITFDEEPIGAASFQPRQGQYLVFSQDTGGSEFFQFWRLELADNSVHRLTDGKSRNTGLRWAHDGARAAFASTRRNGRDTDIYVMDPRAPDTTRRVLEVNGGGWSVMDWSPDNRKLLLGEYVSINEAYLHLLELETGETKLLTPRGPEKTAYRKGQFAADGQSLYATTDRGSEFLRLVRLDLRTLEPQALTAHIQWDVDDFDLSPDGRRLAFVTNEDGISRLRLLEARTGRGEKMPSLPPGVITNLKWHNNSRDLAFNLNAAQSPNDVFSVDAVNLNLERWTESETGGLPVEKFIAPELVRVRSHDGLPLSAFVYRPDSEKFPGKRPSLIVIHGGPEGQARPIFQGRNNYYLNEMGIALVVPNVRGSAGYGKTFLGLDNGFKREDSVRDIGAFIGWIKTAPGLEGERIAVMGGSYGGYMVLASLVHFSDELRAGVDIVGISNFNTFLRHTQDYRRDLRRAEYGDERDEKMREFLESISPARNAQRIRQPLLVVQGQNDPRVPVTESEQMVRAIRGQQGTVWYLLAKDEGHGFAKKKNADFQFLTTIQFLEQFLVR